MEGGRGDNVANTSQEFCQVCCFEESLKVAKYKCPSCGVRTCSLPCVQTHKEQTGCKGRRERTKFVPITQYTEETFLSDYTFLEEVHRVSTAAMVQLQSSKDDHKNPFHTRKNNKLLQRKAKQSNISVCFLPRVFSKAKLNKSVFSVKNQCIFWSLRLVFPYLTLVWQLPRVNENETLKQLLENIFEPLPPLLRNRKQAQLQEIYSQYSVEQLQLYLVLEKRRDSDSKTLDKCDVTNSLKQILQGKLVVEFPTIVVLLPFEDKEIIGNNNPS